MNPQDPTQTTQNTQNQTTPQAENDQPFFMAAGRLRERLEKAGLDADSISFILGRFVSKVSNKVMDEVVEKLADVIMTPEVGGLTDDTARQTKIEQLFTERTGKTIQARREEIAEEMVQEFEKLGKENNKSNS